MENEKIQPGDKVISPHIYNADLCQVLKKNWNFNFKFETDHVILTTQPFNICKIKNFLTQPLGTYDLRGELLSVHNRKRGNDLMKLEESICDLQNITEELTYSKNTECIKQLCSELLTDFKKWLSYITGIELNDKLSIRTSTYTDTDFLLCHNDQVEDRRIAFILYLNKNWTEDCGGQLNLFKSENGVPTEIDNYLVPEYNSLLFFEVTNQSFHSVSEILKNTSRFSVNGWFHGTKITPPPSLRDKETEYYLRPINPDYNISNFIKESRLSNSTFIEIINKVIEIESFCSIKNYIKEEQYENLLQEITSDEIKWIKVGPPDQKNYEIADITTLPNNLRRFHYMFQTIAFCQLLKRYTELELVPSETNNPKVTIQLQRWKQGYYTILHDNYRDNKAKNITTNCKKNDDEKKESPELNRKISGENSTSVSYTVRDMLQDIIVDSTYMSQLLTYLPSSISEQLDDNSSEPKPSCSTDDDDTIPIKRRKIEDGIKDDDVDAESEKGSETKGTLDVIMYFHGANAPPDTTLNYVDPETEDGVFLTLSIHDNALFIVYRQDGIVRHNEYVNHSCKGNFYSLVCSYTE